MINRTLRHLLHSPILFGGLMAAVMLGGFLYSHPGHVAADNGYGCGVTTGLENSMAGMTVNLYWIKADGSGTSQDIDDTVTVQTASPSSTHDGSGNPANVAKMSSDDSTELATVHQRTFRQVNANCGGNGYMVVLGYGKTSSDTADNYSYWALDCDISKHADHYQQFNVWPNGVPAGATSGGYWTTSSGGGGTHTDSGSPYVTSSSLSSSKAAANGFTTSVNFYYVEPPSHNYQAHFPNNLGCKTDVYIWAEDVDHPTNPIQAKVTFSGGPGGLPTLGPVYANDAPTEGVYGGHNSNNYHVWGMPSAIKSYTGTNDITAKLYAYDQNGNIITQNGSPKVFDTDIISTPCAGPPTLSINGSCTNKIIYGLAQDSDYSSKQLTVKISVDGGAALTFTANQSPGHNYSYDASGLTWNAVTYSHTFTVTALGVDFNGNLDGKNTTKSYPLNCKPTTSCAGQNTSPTVSLPQAAPNAPGPYGYSPQGGATTSPSQQYYYEQVVGYQINSAYDQWSPRTDINTTSPVGTEQASNTFTLDYSNYVNQYPYDDHSTTINYYTYFNETYQYSSSSPDYYTCGGSYNGTNPICSYPAYSYYWCPSGGFLWINRCYVYQGAATYHSSTNTYTCSTGSYVFGACYTSYGASLQYYCSPGSLSGTTCYYWGQPWYNWHTAGTTSNKPSNNAVYGGAPQLLECYPRHFNVQGTPQTDVTGVSFDNYENPTRVFISANVSVQFSWNNGGIGVHDPMRVNGLNYNGTYYIKHASGGTTVFQNDSRPGGLNVGSTTANGGTISQGIPIGPYGVSMPPLAVGDKICAEFTIDPSGTDIWHTGDITNGSGSVSSTPIPLGSSCSAPIENHSYTRFYGNDVLAGVVFPGGTCNGAAHITANSTGPTGAGSQFAAMSLGAINGFASAFLRSLAPTQPTGLTFANTTGAWGGSFGGTSCTAIPDYSAEKPADSQSVSDLSLLGGPLAPLGGDTAFTAPGGTLGGLTVPAGANVSLFVNGDLYITDDITFNNSGWSYDSTTHDSTVPSLYIIATGNIDIGPNVHQLDGVYIARGSDGKGGSIRTCSQGSNSAFPVDVLFDNCNSQLVINGAFLAKDVRFDRTFSSLRHSQSGENPLNGAVHNCDPNGITSAADCSGEIFNFSPEAYLANPALQPQSGLNLNKYDYITSLPPVL